MPASPREVKGWPPWETQCGLGKRKDEYCKAQVAERGVDVYDSTIAFMDALRSIGVVMAAVSARSNQRLVLEAAGPVGSFDVLSTDSKRGTWVWRASPTRRCS